MEIIIYLPQLLMCTSASAKSLFWDPSVSDFSITEQLDSVGIPVFSAGETNLIILVKKMGLRYSI